MLAALYLQQRRCTQLVISALYSSQLNMADRHSFGQRSLPSTQISQIWQRSLSVWPSMQARYGQTTEIIRLAHCECKEPYETVVTSVCPASDFEKKLRDIGAKCRHLCRKSGSRSKNTTSDFAPKVAKYPKSSYSGIVRAYCFAPLAMQLVYILNNQAKDSSVANMPQRDTTLHPRRIEYITLE